MCSSSFWENTFQWRTGHKQRTGEEDEDEEEEDDEDKDEDEDEGE